MGLGEEPLRERTVVKKPALSMLALFLSYITDMVFAVLVFIVFLLITGGLHYCGDALAMTRIVFFLRIIELAVISFGTLWCVGFVLKVSVVFAKNLKHQLQKPIKEVGNEPFRLYPRDIARRFGEPWRTHRISLVVCSGIILAVLYVGISFAELVRSDSDDASILACELLCETGPYFPKPVDNHAIMLKDYAKYMDEKYLADVLGVFRGYSPEKFFIATSETLINAKGSQDEVAHEIWRAGEEVILFRFKKPQLLPRGISLHEYRKPPDWLLSDAAVALEESQKASKLFYDKPTMENAVHSCECNRKTMLLLFLLRASYDRPEVASLFTRFRAIVEACKKSKMDIAKRVKASDDPRKEFLEKIIAESEQRRLEIMDDIKSRNMQEAIERMWDAIEIAYSRRDKLLELCAKIRSAGNYSEEITS